MVDITHTEVANALHLASESDLPDGANADIDAAETLVSEQVEPAADTSSSGMVHKCAVYVACAFITGTEGDIAISDLQRESASITFDTENASDEAVDYWKRAEAFDPTGKLGSSTGGSGSMFRAH